MRCAVCSHHGVEQIDAMVNAGKQHATIARVFAVSRHSIDRHVQSGHVVPVASEDPAQLGGPATVNLGPVESLEAELAYLNAMDRSKISPSQGLSLSDAIRRTAADLARHQPAPPPPPGPSIARFMEIVVAAFAEHPDIRAKFFREWRAYRGLSPEVEVEKRRTRERD